MGCIRLDVGLKSVGTSSQTSGNPAHTDILRSDYAHGESVAISPATRVGGWLSTLLGKYGRDSSRRLIGGKSWRSTRTAVSFAEQS